MSDPTTINTTATAIDTGIADAGSAVVNAVEGMILADVPFLALPVVKTLWEAFFNWIAGYFIKAAETGATFAVIDVQTGSESGALSKALQTLIQAEKTGDANAIQAAIKNYADAQSALIHSDGSAHAQ